MLFNNHFNVSIFCLIELFCSLISALDYVAIYSNNSVNQLAPPAPFPIPSPYPATVTPFTSIPTNNLPPAGIFPNTDNTADCSIFIGQTIFVYYWPTGTPNTACLAGLPPAPTLAPPEIPDAISPSVYIIFTSIVAGNAHTRYGDIHTSVTLSFAPDELSSIEGSAGATKAFNFGDLPCPPPDVAAADKYFYNPSFNPTRRYEPRILPPTQISQLDPAFNTCKFASDFQGFDPPHALTKVIGPIPGGRIRTHPKHKRFQRTTAHTHTTTQIPELQSKSNPTPSITASRFRHEAYHKRYQRVVEDAQAVTQPPEITAPPNLT